MWSTLKAEFASTSEVEGMGCCNKLSTAILFFWLRTSKCGGRDALRIGQHFQLSARASFEVV